MLYPKEDKENRILLYAVSASPRGAPVFPTCPEVPNVTPTPCYIPHAPYSRLLTTLSEPEVSCPSPR